MEMEQHQVLEFLASRRTLSTEQINAEPAHFDSESVKDTILELSRHADMEVQQMANHLKEKYLKGSSQKPLRRGQDLSKWRLFPKQNQQESSGAAATEDETTRKRKRASRWDQPSQEVLDTTLAGGLPQSFWPFNANNLLVSTGQQNNVVDHSIRQTEGASVDELGAMHPGPPSFPVPDNLHHDEAAHTETSVVSGIPVEQFTTGSTMGCMTQQGPICIGIPVSQFHGANAPGSGFSYMPQMSTSTPQVNHPPDGQALPFSSEMAQVQEPRQHEFDTESTGKGGEEPDISFGISHSQFFQQMHGMFGSAFHPWQLQSLMAPHAWGPFLAGDARLRDLGFINETGPFRQPSEHRGPEEVSGKPVEPGGTAGYVQEVDPSVPGLSPPLHPQAIPPSFAYPPSSGQAPNRANNRPFMGNEYPGRSNVPHQQLKSSSWKPQHWNSPRWQKFPGNNKYRGSGFRRDFNYSQRNNRQNFGRQGPVRPHNNWEDNPLRKDRSWGHSNARSMDREEPMEMEAVEGFNEQFGPPFQDSGTTSGSVPLERPWGYGQEEYPSGYPSNHPGNFSQDRAKDPTNSRGVNNQ
ncbi:hypothetical protein L7F22_008131 [Adiantum nelumboides]|nr:hypothetical protein [Adiantum nelumboides]